MIRINGKNLMEVRLGNREVPVLMLGGKEAWKAILSCFGRGFWRNTTPWKTNEGWSN